MLEGANIIGNYRTAIIKSDKWKNEEHRQIALSAVTKWALIAAAGAVAVVVAVAIPLGLLSQELDERVVEIIEGVSKVVAAVCILQLTLKIPVWLDLYEKPCKKMFFIRKPLTGRGRERSSQPKRNTFQFNMELVA